MDWKTMLIRVGVAVLSEVVRVLTTSKTAQQAAKELVDTHEAKDEALRSE